MSEGISKDLKYMLITFIMTRKFWYIRDSFENFHEFLCYSTSLKSILAAPYLKLEISPYLKHLQLRIFLCHSNILFKFQ